MTVSEDHASCWVHKNFTVTTKQIQSLLTAARASGGKDECQVQLTGVEREYWMGTKIGRLCGYSFRGTITAGDGSNQNGGKIGAGSVTNHMLYLCDNQALLKAVKRWVGGGGKATLVGAPDADILPEVIEELRKRTTARAAMFLTKAKAHRGEPANEEADIQADKAVSGKDVPTEWHDRTNRAVFT